MAELTNHPELREKKREFQLERMILFSDAVFAIAITLLVIELKLPHMEDVTNQALRDGLIQIIPNIYSFFLSFMIIGIYWIAHHQMFYYVINYNRKMIWLNLFLLFFIALMPFSSNVFGVYGGYNTAFYLYVFNITMVALFNYLLYNYISKPGSNLSFGLENRRLVLYYKVRALVVPICFGIGVIFSLTLYDGWAILFSRMSPILIYPVLSIVKKRFSDVSNLNNT